MVPGFAVTKVEDTNGAGGSFWGGFLYKISTSEKQMDELTIKEMCIRDRFHLESLVKNFEDAFLWIMFIIHFLAFWLGEEIKYLSGREPKK